MCETTESKKKKKNQNDTLDTLLVFYSLVFLFFFEFGYLLGCGFMGGGGRGFGDYCYFCTVLLPWCVQGKNILPDDTSTVPSFTAFCSAALTQQSFFMSRKKILAAVLAVPKDEQHR